VSQPPAGRGEKVSVVADVHQRLRDGEGDDLRVRHATPSVLRSIGQEIVSGAEHRYEQQVEVGEHRGPLGSTALLSTADFDPAARYSLKTTPSTTITVESTI
jgi:hypothetical protein